MKNKFYIPFSNIVVGSFFILTLLFSILYPVHAVYGSTEPTSENTEIMSSTSEVTTKALVIETTTKVVPKKHPVQKKLSTPVRKKKKHRKKYATVKSLRLNQSKIRLNKGDYRYLNLSVKYKKSRRKKEEIRWKSSRPSVVKVNQKGVVYGRKNGKATIKVYSKKTKKCVKCKVIVAPTKYIAITFDDGPGASTTRLLNALNKYDSKATFLIVGQLALQNPSIVKKEYRYGMQIGNHTWSHANLKACTTSEVKQQINLCKKGIKKILGHKPTIFRPPYGNYNDIVANAVDVPMIFWSVDTLDWKYRNTNYVCNTILNNASDGAVVLLHDIHSTSVDGFIKAQPTLIKRHYELVTVAELFKIKHKKMKKGVMYYNAK
ncbi:MAG: polysaccharide deacetylase family protein [Eubacterium sp.]|nr:polysaccharide deacetylase family protein [Eubacterium sp.]